MKQGFKLLSVLLLTLLLLAVSATAQINWLKQDGSINYLAWDNGSKSKIMYNGNVAAFATGYFGSTASQTVHLTATLNSKTDGKIVSTIVSKEVNVANTLGYQVITILPENYKNKAGEYIIVIKLKDVNTELVDTSLYLKVNPIFLTIDNLTPTPALINTEPVMNYILDKQVWENHNLQFTVSATDAQNDDLKYQGQVCTVQIGQICLSWSTLIAKGASLNQNTGEFKWKPSYEFVQHPDLFKKIKFRFRADDGQKKSAWQAVTVTVDDVNRNPIFDNIGSQEIEEGELLQFEVNATDADGDDDLQYSVTTMLPEGALFDANLHQFTWVPTSAQIGTYHVTFKVEDNYGGKNFKMVTIKVTEKLATPAQCDDGIDNDGDGLIDKNDPGCHTDGNAGNINSYNQNDDDESNNVVLPPKLSQHMAIDLLSAHLEEEINAGKTLLVNVRLHNNGKADAKELKVEAKIYDLGVLGSTGKSTLTSGKNIERNIYVPLPEDAQPGWYLIKITAINGTYHTSTYRLVHINSNTF